MHRREPHANADADTDTHAQANRNANSNPTTDCHTEPDASSLAHAEADANKLAQLERPSQRDHLANPEPVAKLVAHGAAFSGCIGCTHGYSGHGEHVGATEPGANGDSGGPADNRAEPAAVDLADDNDRLVA